MQQQVNRMERFFALRSLNFFPIFQKKIIHYSSIAMVSRDLIMTSLFVVLDQKEKSRKKCCFVFQFIV